jgi:hypothetical protein
MHRIVFVIAAAACLSISGTPVFAAAACPANGAPYSIKGVVKQVSTTNSGQTYYSILHPRCGSSEDNTIAVYPAAPEAACDVGKHASAKGTYSMDCPSDADAFGGVCVALLNNATISCK